ncbi:cholesterol 25-hydroxylase-like protein 1, member 2 [Protopterus annectens]|uniref:cholesterol 25-hydroxylase-like protein 1, member 2 n=1 Tax=Protopterus annectens TaxID=7888 RepID=UPI001CFA5A2E|nr:cholesterol 25-hydroxylase-like protein 1, member 2 [Protopterus annectens]
METILDHSYYLQIICPNNEKILQPFWDYLCTNYLDIIRSPLFPVILTVSCYFIFCIPYLICNMMGRRWPFIHKYKIHQNRNPNLSMILRCCAVTAYNHLFFIFPASVAQWYWRPPLPLPEEAPSIAEVLIGVVGCLLLFDFQYFIWHLIHHKNKWLYKTFHALHHEYMAPFSLATQCLGGWELITVGFWTSADPIFLKCHLLTTWVFMVCHVYVSVEDHSGYDFPWSTSRLVPFGIYGGPVMHDVHHQRPMTNFAPHFSHMDRLLGTHSKFSYSKGYLEPEGVNETCCASNDLDSLYDDSITPSERTAMNNKK